MTFARKESKHHQKKERGFTLIEMLVALLIVLLGIVFISQVCVHSMDTLAKSWQRLEISEKFQCFSHYLLSRSFDSEELHAGHYSRVDRQFIIYWDVDDLNTGLKAITLCVRRSHLTRRGILLKSATILTVGVMETRRGESEIPIYLHVPERETDKKVCAS